MKVWNYIIIMAGLVIGAYVLGIAPDGSQQIFGIFDVGTNGTVGGVGTFTSSTFSIGDFFLYLFDTAALVGILLGIAGVGVVAGLTGGRYSVENFIILPFITTVLIKFIQVFAGITSSAIASGQNWFIAVMFMLMIPFTVGFVLALVEFFRGTD